MPRQPLSRERICEALESCRPSSNDLSAPDFAHIADQVAASPELEELFGQIQAVDQKISAAFHDVPIPPGLQERLLASLALSEADRSPSLEVKTDADHIPAEVTLAAPAPPKERHVSRRWLLIGSGTLTVATALFFAILWGMTGTAKYTKETVLTDAKRFFEADNPSEPSQLLAKVPPPHQFPYSKHVRGDLNRTCWRPVKDFLGREGIAFDLPALAGSRATLYAVPLKIDGLDNAPTRMPSSNTGGCSMSTWQEGGLVYVLVVQGSEKSYQNYLNRPSGPMA